VSAVEPAAPVLDGGARARLPWRGRDTAGLSIAAWRGCLAGLPGAAVMPRV
jgi:hypothetical protein